MVEKSIKPNGYAVRSWGDILAVALLVSLLLGVLAWGLKLESELNTVRDQVSSLREQVGNGILPRAEERIEALDKRVEDLEDKK